MRKASICLAILLTILLAMPASASAQRTTSITSDIVFDDTSANCFALIIGNSTSDTISATMVLKRGNTLVDKWSGSGNGTLKLTGTANATAGKYTLIVNATINNIPQPAVTIYRSKTNA